MENIYQTIRGRTKSPRTLESNSIDPLSAAKPLEWYILASGTPWNHMLINYLFNDTFIHWLILYPISIWLGRFVIYFIPIGVLLTRVYIYIYQSVCYPGPLNAFRTDTLIHRNTPIHRNRFQRTRAPIHRYTETGFSARAHRYTDTPKPVSAHARAPIHPYTETGFSARARRYTDTPKPVSAHARTDTPIHRVQPLEALERI